MADVSLVKQLSGPEVIDSILAQLKKKLSIHGRLQPNSAYSGYRAELIFKFYPAASFIPPVTYSAEVQDVPDDAILSETATVEAHIEIPVKPPNKVREESGLPTPVLGPDDKGNIVEKWVHLKPAEKNKVRGGHSGLPAQTMVPAIVPVGKGELEAAVEKA